MPRPKRPARRPLEIYFVLYLASIVTLFTVANERNAKERQLTEVIAALSRPDFRVNVERIALTYQYFPEGVAHEPTQLQQDTANVISAAGSFDRADFSLVSVIDTITGEILPAEHLSLEQVGRDSARFSWSPHVTAGNHVYRVTVRVSAVPQPPEVLKDEALRRDVMAAIADRSSIMGTDAVFTINAYALGLQVPTPVPATAMLDVPFSLEPRVDVIGAFVNVPWQNTIIVSGADVRKQMAKPDASSPGGALQVNIAGPTTFQVSGLFSQVGTQDVAVTGLRLPDRKTFTATFRVNARALPQPLFPSLAYAGEEYRFDINTKDIPVGQLALELRIGNVTKIAREMNQAVVTYTPDANDLGQTIALTSYLNSRPVGSARLPIVALPRPEIIAIEPDGDGFLVSTRSCGHYGNLPNRTRLLVREGNVSEPEEITAQYHYDEVQKAHYQRWRLVRKSGGSVQLTIYAIDSRGLDYKSPDVIRTY
jgi:hypothetical protein